MRSAKSPNKQLQRTVTRRRGRHSMLRYVILFPIVFATCAVAQEQLSEAERKEMALVLLQRGIAAFEAADYENAAKDYEQSLQYWSHVTAAANLCNLYLYGVGVPRNPERARALCEAAARHDEPNALTMLGEMYQRGEDVPEDRAKALQYLRRAAELGHVHGQYAYGFLLSGTDLAEAVRWLTRAADRGYEPAKRALEYIESATTRGPD